MVNKNLIQHLIASLDLNLEGLNVYTEAASGHYMYAPILAALAGAKSVTAQVSNSRYGLARDIICETNKIACDYDLSHVVTCVDQRDYSKLAAADIVTNAGHVRPIDRDLVDALKPTAVIPLMWETWEFRESDFDLVRCRERGILVLGTNEQTPLCDMRPFIGLAGLKLILGLGYDGGSILLLGNSPLPGEAIVNHLRKLKLSVTWVSNDPSADLPYSELKKYFLENGNDYSHLIVAEHQDSTLLLGSGGLLNFEDIHCINPELRIGVFCGNIDNVSLQSSGLRFLPKRIAPFGFITYQLSELGARPILRLYAAGLKVGEQMAKARLSGLCVRDAAQLALKESPAMDFENYLSWIKA